MNVKKLITSQIIAPMQQWLLEQGKCVVCGQSLSSGKRESRKQGEVVVCPCGEQYFYLPKAKLYKRLSAGRYA